MSTQTKEALTRLELGFRVDSRAAKPDTARTDRMHPSVSRDTAFPCFAEAILLAQVTLENMDPTSVARMFDELSDRRRW